LENVIKNIVFYNQEIDLSTVFRIYPATLIEHQKVQTEMSLEWIEQNEDKVKILSYRLIFDYDKNRERQTKLDFDNREDLIKAINEIYEIIQDRN